MSRVAVEFTCGLCQMYSINTMRLTTDSSKKDACMHVFCDSCLVTAPNPVRPKTKNSCPAPVCQAKYTSVRPDVLIDSHIKRVICEGDEADIVEYGLRLKKRKQIMADWTAKTSGISPKNHESMDVTDDPCAKTVDAVEFTRSLDHAPANGAFNRNGTLYSLFSSPRCGDSGDPGMEDITTTVPVKKPVGNNLQYVLGKAIGVTTSALHETEVDKEIAIARKSWDDKCKRVNDFDVVWAPPRADYWDKLRAYMVSVPASKWDKCDCDVYMYSMLSKKGQYYMSCPRSVCGPNKQYTGGCRRFKWVK